MKGLFDKCKLYKKYIQLEDGIVDLDEYGYKVIEKNSVDCGYVHTVCATLVQYEFPQLHEDKYFYIYGSLNAHIDIEEPLGDAIYKVFIGNCVTEIANSSFAGPYYAPYVAYIGIPDSVIRIGDEAFTWCYNIHHFEIPDSVIYIGKEAFLQCQSLESIKMSNSITEINDGLFYNCIHLKSFTIPSGVTYIGKEAFWECRSLSSIGDIPNGVTSIEEKTFFSCDSLSSITIPDSVTSIGEYAFGGCDSLSSITIPDSVTSIGEYAFSRCSSLTSVTIGSGVTYFGEGVFESGTSITTVVLSDGLTSLGCEIFGFCPNITSVTIPDSVVKFDNCSWWPEKPSVFAPTSIDGELICSDEWYNNLSEEMIGALGNVYLWRQDPKLIVTYKDGEIYRLKDRYATAIGSRTLEGMESQINIISVEICSGITEIYSNTFNHCDELISVAIDKTVTLIGNSAFYWCPKLSSITYNGTIAQWNAITKYTMWNSGIPSTCILHCTDGDITFNN